MLRSSLTSMGIVLLGTAAIAQSDMSARVRPITSPVKNAGVLHLGTGTWTRNATAQAFLSGPEIVYANTCNSGYYFGNDSGEQVTDEGAIPDQGQAQTPSGFVAGGFDTDQGCQQTYNINGFQIAYCTYSTTFTAEVNFYDNYEAVGTACSVPGAPTASFAISGLPATTTVGVQACWIVSLDLAAQTPPANFSLTGTGTNGTIFGWSFNHTSPNMDAANQDGQIIAGKPDTCTGTDSTRWDRGTASVAYPGNYNQVGNFPVATEEGTGMLTLDAFRTDFGTSFAPGCYWFQGFPTTGVFGSFHLELYSDVNCPQLTIGTPMCFPGQNGVINCPCGNNPSSPDRGCNNSFNTGGAKLALTGNPSLSNDTVTITATDERPNVTSLFLQGNNVLASGVVFGDGVRCAGGQLLRLNSPGGTPADGAGTVVYPTPVFTQPVSVRAAALGQPISAGQTRWYQTYYRDPDLNFCPAPTGNSWNVTHGVALVWQP